MDTSWCIHAQGPQPWHRKLLLHHTARMSWDGFQWWVLTPSPAASLGEGKGNSSGWALPGLTQSKGWLWLWSSLLAATVSLLIGSGFGERAGVAAYTLALCFCTSLQGMWERKKSWADMLWDWMQCRRTGQAARPPPVMSSPPEAGLRSCCDMEEPPPWPPAHCCVGAVSQGAVRGSQGMWSCYGGDLRVKAFLVRGGGWSRWKCPNECRWWALPSVLAVKVPVWSW